MIGCFLICPNLWLVAFLFVLIYDWLLWDVDYYRTWSWTPINETSSERIILLVWQVLEPLARALICVHQALCGCCSSSLPHFYCHCVMISKSINCQIEIIIMMTLKVQSINLLCMMVCNWMIVKKKLYCHCIYYLFKLFLPRYNNMLIHQHCSRTKSIFYKFVKHGNELSMLRKSNITVQTNSWQKPWYIQVRCSN